MAESKNFAGNNLSSAIHEANSGIALRFNSEVPDIDVAAGGTASLGRAVHVSSAEKSSTLDAKKDGGCHGCSFLTESRSESASPAPPRAVMVTGAMQRRPPTSDEEEEAPPLPLRAKKTPPLPPRTYRRSSLPPRPPQLPPGQRPLAEPSTPPQPTTLDLKQDGDVLVEPETHFSQEEENTNPLEVAPSLNPSTTVLFPKKSLRYAATAPSDLRCAPIVKCSDCQKFRSILVDMFNNGSSLNKLCKCCKQKIKVTRRISN